MEMFGEEEGTVGGDGGKRNLDQVILRVSRQHQDRPGHHGSAHHAAADHEHGHRDYAGGGHAAACDKRCDNAEGNRGGAVVEKAFGFHEEEQAAARSGFAERGDYGDGIGGGDEHAEESGAEPLPVRDVVHSHGGDGAGKDHAQAGQHDNDGKILAQLLPGKAVGGLENKRWEQRRKDEVFGEADHRFEGQQGQAESDAHGHQAGAVRQAEPAREHGDHGRYQQQAGDDVEAKLHPFECSRGTGGRLNSILIFSLRLPYGCQRTLDSDPYAR